MSAAVPIMCWRCPAESGCDVFLTRWHPDSYKQLRRPLQCSTSATAAWECQSATAHAHFGRAAQPFGDADETWTH